MPNLAYMVRSDDWRRRTEHVARLCGWSLVPLGAATRAVADAYLVQHERDDGMDAAIIALELAAQKPLCIIVGGSYSADKLQTDLEGHPNITFISAWHPKVAGGPVNDWGPDVFYGWLAQMTPGFAVVGFEFSGDHPRSESSVGRLTIRGGLVELLRTRPDEMYRLTPDQFEAVVCDRLDAMGYEPVRIGAINAADGGVDIIATPRIAPFPYLVAVQIKHRNRPAAIGPDDLRQIEGVASRDEFNLGVLVTNATFTPDARWVAEARRSLLRLRDVNDVTAWLHGQFSSLSDVHLPATVELRPRLTVAIPWPGPNESVR